MTAGKAQVCMFKTRPLGCPFAQHRVENARPQFFGLNRRRSFFADPNHLVAAFAARGIHDKFLAVSLRPLAARRMNSLPFTDRTIAAKATIGKHDRKA